jgi:hypothetical protein
MVSSLLKSILTFILLFLGLEYIAFDKSKVFAISFFLSIFSLITSLTFIGKNKIETDRFAFIFFPILFLASIIGFFVFIPGEILRHIFAVFGSAFFAFLNFYIGNLAAKKITLDSKNKYYSLGEISILICAFLSYTCIFGLFLFLNLPTWALMSQVLIFSLFISYFYFCYNKIKFNKSLIFYLVFSLVSSELAWAISFWPTGFISRAVVLFMLFYVFSGLVKHYFQKSLNKKILREYLVVGILILFLTLGTTRWTF